jgi:hypothetical protein
VAVISSAARKRIEQVQAQLAALEEEFEQKVASDPLDSYEAALNRGKARAYQHAANLVSGALHDIDVKAL